MRVPKRSSISVRGVVHQRLKNYADDHDRSLSSLCEEFIADKLQEVGAPPAPKPETQPDPKSKPEPAVPTEVVDEDSAKELGEPEVVEDIPPAVMYL